MSLRCATAIFFRWNPFTFGQEEFVIRGYLRLRIRSYLIGIDMDPWIGCSRGHWKNPSDVTRPPQAKDSMVLTGKSHTSIAVNILDSTSLDIWTWTISSPSYESRLSLLCLYNVLNDANVIWIAIANPKWITCTGKMKVLDDVCPASSKLAADNIPFIQCCFTYWSVRTYHCYILYVEFMQLKREY